MALQIQQVPQLLLVLAVLVAEAALLRRIMELVPLAEADLVGVVAVHLQAATPLQQAPAARA